MIIAFIIPPKRKIRETLKSLTQPHKENPEYVGYVATL